MERKVRSVVIPWTETTSSHSRAWIGREADARGRSPHEARSMTRLDPATAAAGAFGVGILLIALTGCAQLDRLVSREHEESFATYADAEAGWVGVGIPDWIPDDATELRNVATFDETVAVMRVTTDEEPVGCTTAERRGLPALAADWSVPTWPDEVLRCGDYEVMPVDDGWLGWFQAREPGQRPE